MVIKSFPRNGKISLTRDRKMNYFIYTSHARDRMFRICNLFILHSQHFL